MHHHTSSNQDHDDGDFLSLSLSTRQSSPPQSPSFGSAPHSARLLINPEFSYAVSRSSPLSQSPSSNSVPYFAQLPINHQEISYAVSKSSPLSQSPSSSSAPFSTQLSIKSPLSSQSPSSSSAPFSMQLPINQETSYVKSPLSQSPSPSSAPFSSQLPINQEISYAMYSSLSFQAPLSIPCQQPATTHHFPDTSPTVDLPPHQRETTMNPIVGPPPHHQDKKTVVVGPSRKRRMARRSSNQILRPGKTETIPSPYPWATTRRATVHNLQYLVSKGINTISGRVQCKRCDRQFEIEYNLHEKFNEVAIYIMKHKDDMRHRAPAVWMNPTLPDCKFCGQKNCVKPILSKKKAINWLFLLLGQMIGCCKLSELKYFCKHTRNHRTGAKDRVLYLSYVELCRQLDPEGSYVHVR